MKFGGFIGPTYKLDSVSVDCQRCVNLYPEMIQSGTGKEGQQYYLKSTPGLIEQFSAGTGPIRLIHRDSAGRIFVVSGKEVYKCVYTGSAWIKELLPDELLTETGPVRAASIFPGFDENFTVFVDGVTSYLYWWLDPDEFFGPFSDFAYPSVDNPTHVVYIDGYLIFNSANTNQFFVSDWNAFTVDPLSFASAEADPDFIVALMASYRQLWAFNERSIEVFVNVGNADFPFERVSGGLIEIGCVAPFSVGKIDGTMFWLGRDQSGEGIVYAASGLNPQRISTHSVEQAIAGYENIKDATGYTYKDGGHSFFVLNFSEATWVYDMTTGLWHERAYTGEVDLERHLADMHVFYPDFHMHLVGDYESGKVYSLSNTTYTDNGNAITRMRVFPHVSSNLKRLFCSFLQIDMETGVGLDGDVQGSDPQAMLDWSDDGGHTFSNEVWGSIGRKIGGIGSFKTRLIWRRLGSFRDRVFRLKITDPVPVTLLSAEIDLQQGGN